MVRGGGLGGRSSYRREAATLDRASCASGPVASAAKTIAVSARWATASTTREKRRESCLPQVHSLTRIASASGNRTLVASRLARRRGQSARPALSGPSRNCSLGRASFVELSLRWRPLRARCLRCSSRRGAREGALEIWLDRLVFGSVVADHAVVLDNGRFVFLAPSEIVNVRP